jgi:hypothetical protein
MVGPAMAAVAKTAMSKARLKILIERVMFASFSLMALRAPSVGGFFYGAYCERFAGRRRLE